MFCLKGGSARGKLRPSEAEGTNQLGLAANECGW
jgi:hypothetical protein